MSFLARIPRMRIDSASKYFFAKIMFYGLGILGSAWLIISVFLYHMRSRPDLSLLVLSFAVFCFSIMLCGLQSIKYASYSREVVQHLEAFRNENLQRRANVSEVMVEDKPPSYLEALREETPPPTYHVALVLSSLDHTEV